MISFPHDAQAAAAALTGGTATGVVRAGSTDLSEIRRLGMAQGNLVDLRDATGLDAITFADGVLTIGALVTVQDLADHVDGKRAPALAAAAGALATPQIRRRATVGGNVLQRNRCWYFRNRELSCLQKGGGSCLARAGHADRHAVFDNGSGCSNVHASTVAMALLLHDAEVQVLGAKDSAPGQIVVRSVADVLGDGKDSSRDHALEPGAVLTAFRVPVTDGERGGYARVAQRAFAEWASVEAGVRLVVVDGSITVARVAVGAVARVPRRLPAVEAALVGKPPTAETFAAAAAKAADGANPLPGSAWKVPLIAPCVEDALVRAMEAS